MIKTQSLKEIKAHTSKVSQGTVIHTQDLTIGYQKNKTSKVISRDLNLVLHPGELVCLLGPNGVGKSTLMRTLASIQPPLSGKIYLHDRLLNTYTKRNLAEEMSLVLTEKLQVGNLNVYNILTLGRYPYLNWFGQLREKDKEIIRWAIRQTGIASFLNRHINELSDGEKQKVMIARALVQETPLIILDEPTAHLDLPNRIEIMRLLKRMAEETNKAILLSTHELDLALQAADAVWLMMPNQTIAMGAPEDLVIDGAFQSAFQKPGVTFDLQSGTFKFSKWDGRKVIALEGEQLAHLWTSRALERIGYRIDPKADLKISIYQTNSLFHWHLVQGEQVYKFSRIEQLIKFLKE